MVEKNLDSKRNQSILKALNEAIKEGPWNTTIFFQALKNKLIEIRDKFKAETGLNEELEGDSYSSAYKENNTSNGSIEVYILLYNAEGNSIPKWENILKSISSQIISRPIYRNEEDAKAALKAASIRMNEAYVSIYLHQKEILPAQPHRVAYDRNGREIISIKEDAIHQENIHAFIHASGQYEFKNNKLTWQKVVELT